MVKGLRRVPVSAPALVGREAEYVQAALASGWISSAGPFIDRFEARFSELHAGLSALTCANGTVALHLALVALGIGKGDEVIVPTLTYVATANAVAYTGATPVFVDSLPGTMAIDPDAVAAAVTHRTRAVIPVHLYGHPVDMDRLVSALPRTDIAVVEDAAEALGSTYKGRPTGTLGDVATFSFFGNKTISTGEGGMVLVRDPKVAARARQLRGQGMDPDRRYWFPVIGFNYRMTNMQAAVGLGQLEKFDWHVSRRQEVAAQYNHAFAELDGTHLELPLVEPWATSSAWLYTVVLSDGARLNRDDLILRLEADGIESRPVFYPMHVMPPYRSTRGVFPVAERLGARGISLPTHAQLTENDIALVADRVRHHLGC
jgi:perosamine synthetase